MESSIYTFRNYIIDYVMKYVHLRDLVKALKVYIIIKHI